MKPKIDNHKLCTRCWRCYYNTSIVTLLLAISVVTYKDFQSRLHFDCILYVLCVAHLQGNYTLSGQLRFWSKNLIQIIFELFRKQQGVLNGFLRKSGLWKVKVFDITRNLRFTTFSTDIFTLITLYVGTATFISSKVDHTFALRREWASFEWCIEWGCFIK